MRENEEGSVQSRAEACGAVHPIRVTPNPGEAEHAERRPWALMASGSLRRPTLKEAGFWRRGWNAGPACSSGRSLGLRVCESGSAKGT